MGLRGPKPKGKVKIEWSANFAYGVGLLVSDGNLSPDGRHIVFTSKDYEMTRLFQKALGFKNHTGRKSSKAGEEKKYYVVQFSDVLFYKFLISIGHMPNKSKVISGVKVPDEYFFNFLLGSFDGDGCIYAYFDPRWKSSFMFYTTFVSASKKHIDWLRKEIHKRLGISGHTTGDGRKTIFQLKYAKASSLKLLRAMYPNENILCLSRKRLKIERILRTIGASLVE